MSSRFVAVAALGVAVACSFVATPRAVAQMADLPMIVQPVALDSGQVANPGDRAATMFSQDITAGHVPWMRLIFDDIALEGASYLVISSHQDRDFQVLSAEAVRQWQNTSAFFNGNAVTLGLVAAPGTTKNHVKVSRVLCGGPPPGVAAGDRAVCENVDNRVVSTDGRTARLLSVRLPVPNCPDELPCVPQNGGVCTGELTNEPLADDPNNRVMLSAGHCFDFPGQVVMSVAQFEPIPFSATDCSIRHPPSTQQYAVNPTRTRSENLGPCTGHDWAAFTCFPNPNTNLTPFLAQNVAYNLTAGPPILGSPLTKFGYGVQGPRNNTTGNGRGPYCGCVPGNNFATFNTTQQTADGRCTAAVAVDNVIHHDVQTCAGDSGCPIIDANDRLMGIHVGGGCGPSPAPPGNCATSVLAPNVAAGIAAVAGSAAPRNDACADALTIVNGVTPFSTIGATGSGPAESACIANSVIDRDIWFRYVATSAQTRISLCGSRYDTKMAVYNGACPTLANTALACNDDTGRCPAFESELSVATTAGQPYLIRVGGPANNSGTGVIEIIPNDVPSNDVCGLIPGIGLGTREFSTAGATTDGPAEAIGQIDNDIWYFFTPGDPNGVWPSVPGTYTIETCQGTSFDTMLALYRGACPGGPNTADASNDDTVNCGNGTQSRVSIAVSAAQLNTSIVLRVGGKNNARGAGVLKMSFKPANDDCADAFDAALGDTLFDGRGAGNDGAVPDPCGATADIWFKFTAAAAGRYIATTCAPSAPGPAAPQTDFDTRLQVIRTNCAGASAGCGDNECGVLSRVSFTAAAGENFRIRIGGRSGQFGRGTLTILGPQPAAPPFNDECANALTLVDGANSADNAAATKSGNRPTCFPDDAGMPATPQYKDIWFRYTASATGNLDVSTCTATFDTLLAAHAGPCIGAELACNDDQDAAGLDPACPGLSPDTTSRINFPVTAGTTYFIRFAGKSNAVGPAIINVKLIPNDRCQNIVNVPRVADGVTPFDTEGAVTDVPPEALAAPCAVGTNIFRGIYYRYTASITGPTRFTTCANFFTVIAVYQSATCAGAVTANQVGCNSANVNCGGGNMQSQATVNTVAGRQYVIHVGGGTPLAGGGPVFGSGTLTITPVTGNAPLNDNCRTAFTAAMGPNPLDTTNATTDGVPDALCNNMGSSDIFNDVWYDFFPPTAGTYSVDTCAGATFDTKIAVYYNTCPPPVPVPPAPVVHTPLACNDDTPGCGQLSRVVFSVSAADVNNGVDFVIRIGAFANGTTGTGIFTIKRVSPNDNCNQPGTAYDGVQTFDTTGATTDGGVGAGDCPMGQDIWLQYTAAATKRLKVHTCGSSFDTVLAFHADAGIGACPPARLIGCSDDSSACGAGSRQSQVIVNVTAGRTYTIRLGGFGTAQGPGVLTIIPFCAVDYDLNGRIEPVDIALFINDWFLDTVNGTVVADFDGSQTTDPADVAAFVAAWFAVLGGGPC